MTTTVNCTRLDVTRLTENPAQNMMKRMLDNIPTIPEARINEMLEEGQWCYWEQEAKLINIGTGEMVTHIDWLIKEIK